MTEQLSLFRCTGSTDEKLTVGHKKTCPKCCNTFYVPDGQHRAKAYCPSCMSSYHKTLNALKKKHPVPENHSCDCCGKSEEELTVHYSKNGNPMSIWRLDHCHETDEFRGWLCMNCNSGLGRFYDDPDLLRKAITYIQKNRH